MSGGHPRWADAVTALLDTPSARPGEAQIEFFGGWASPGEPQSAGPRSLLLK